MRFILGGCTYLAPTLVGPRYSVRLLYLNFMLKVAHNFFRILCGLLSSTESFLF